MRVGKPLPREHYIDVNGSVFQASDSMPTVLRWHLPVIRKIEKPKRYRPFANAAEFEPHRDRWLKPKLGRVDHRLKTHSYNDRKHYTGNVGDTWQTMFDDYEFEDGTPFGVEVTE